MTWHERSYKKIPPQKNKNKQSETHQGTWQRRANYICMLRPCVSLVPTTSCPVAVPAHAQESVLPVCVALWACNSVKARWAPWDGLRKIQTTSEDGGVHTSPSVEQTSSWVCVLLCGCACTKETFSVTSSTLSLLLLEYQSVTWDTHTGSLRNAEPYIIISLRRHINPVNLISLLWDDACGIRPENARWSRNC